MRKCEYCKDEATTIYGFELLCERHYDALYLKSSKIKQLKEVPKTEKEKKLSAKYMKILENFDFNNMNDFQKLIKKFKRDARSVIAENKKQLNKKNLQL